MNKVEFFWKKESIVFMSECITQSVFNKNYNRILEFFNKNMVDKVLNINSNDFDVEFEIISKDGLIQTITYKIERC